MRHVLLLTALLSNPATAEPDRMSVLLGSQHLGASVNFEQVNPGVFLTWEHRALGLDYSVGAYRNSYGRGSVAVLAALPVVKWPKGQVAVFAGLALYPHDGRTFRTHVGDVVPMGGIQIRQGNTFTQIMPGDGGVADAVISFGITFELGE